MYVDDTSAIHNPAYADKAQIRRQTVGSDVPHGKTEQPASVDRWQQYVVTSSLLTHIHLTFSYTWAFGYSHTSHI